MTIVCYGRKIEFVQKIMNLLEKGIVTKIWLLWDKDDKSNLMEREIVSKKILWF